MLIDMPYRYDDAGGVDTPRHLSTTKTELPNVRLVSLAISDSTAKKIETQVVTQTFVFWGQFIDHDLSFSELSSSLCHQGCSQPRTSRGKVGHRPCFGGGGGGWGRGGVTDRTVS